MVLDVLQAVFVLDMLKSLCGLGYAGVSVWTWMCWSLCVVLDVLESLCDLGCAGVSVGSWDVLEYF